MAINPVHNERLLLEKVADGNEQAFAKLYDAYHQQLGEYVLNITESLSITEEIVQDVFVKLWLNRHILPELNSFPNYIFILLRNHTLNYLRKKSSERSLYLQWAQSFQPEEAPDEASEQFRVWIEEAVEALPARQKEIYHLSRHQRLTHKQIADQLQLSQHTVKTHLERAIASIKEHVQSKVPAALLFLFLYR